MSILIKGMEMPKSCYYCPFADGVWQKNKRCLINGEEMPRDGRNVQQNHLICPLIEVPPHGRLIDADALVEDLEWQCKEVFRIDAVSPDDYWITRNEAYNEALWKTWVESFDNYLKTRPAVIPADKDGESR